MKQILMVCTGNICRSPMATGLLRQRLSAAGLAHQVAVSSAGVFGLDGYRASQPGVEVLADQGIDISDHRARTISERDLYAADLVLVMEEGHRRSLFHRYPQMLHKVFLLSEMAREHGDVEDPYRMPKEEYERCAGELDRLIEAGFENMLRRVGVVWMGGGWTSVAG